ncbi:MAG TPA: ATP-dependent sacrificial sulfur transferase LarE [Bryobacteraceae bacterium]|nr:ATP-dependent sacrificial sulfur transferase LarE [Bryobacteraceae bacterium]
MSTKLSADRAGERRDPAEKQEKLAARLRDLGSVLVAFSGGADSAYLAWMAHQTLGARALAITALSPSFSAYDRQQAEAFAARATLRHEFIETHEFENPEYVANQADRCYHCKTELFGVLAKLRAERGFSAVTYGVNADDLQDFRPGHRAASEFGVVAPLLDAGLAKAEIRELSRRAGLETWDRPASACLSSRVPYGMPVTVATLSRIERAESALRGFGFRQVRVRAHENLARIEIALDELPRALQPDTAAAIAARIRECGFDYVTLDMEGYRQGSLNAALKIKKN